MSECHNKCPEQTVFDPPTSVYQDYYHPQVVNVLHPVEIIRRHHCVPMPNHQYCFSVKDVYCGGPELRGKKRGR